MQVCITIDMEQDCPPFLTTFRGVSEGAPRLLSLLADEGVPGTFFTTGDVARRHPDVVQRIVDGGHELGCHGDTHRRFSTMDAGEARHEIEAASEVLRRYYPVVSFRAPNLDFPRPYLGILRDAGYRFDSSRGRHKPGSLLEGPSTESGLERIPATIAPSAIRLPGPVRHLLCRFMRDPVVLFFHPWEFIDVTREPLPIDCRYRTGQPALDSLRDTIRFFRARGASFRRIREVVRA
jgi:peptidoglycan/xylan/chitin deacetylase (PgdA/CDA1 family)